LQPLRFRFKDFAFWSYIQKKHDSSREALYKCLQSDVVYERRGFPEGAEESFFVVDVIPVGRCLSLTLAFLVKSMFMKSPRLIAQKLEK
jgi:hypothetical protein